VLLTRVRKELAVIAMLILVMAGIIIYLLMHSFEGSMQRSATTTSPSGSESTTPGSSIVVYSASISCSSTDPKAMVISGDCILILHVKNNGTKPVTIYTLVFPEPQFRVPVEEEIEPGEERILRRNFNLPNPIPLNQVLSGILETSAGKVSTPIMIAV